MYKTKLLNLGRTYEAEGETVLESISKLQPLNPKGKCVLTITHGDATKERVLHAGLVLHIFHSRGLAREAALKGLAATFNI